MSEKVRPHYPDVLGVIVEGFVAGEGIIASGSAKPVDATAGYQAGCLFFVRGGAAGVCLYKNEGTLASCLFVPVSTGGLDLSTLVATAAELNRSAQNSTREVAAGAATLALTVALHEGRTVLCDQAAGVTFTLPSAVAGVVGARFRIVVSVTTTSNSDVVQVANASDFMIGLVFALSDDGTGGPVKGWATTNTGTVATESDTVTLNRSTTGTAVKGQWLEFECVGVNVWQVRGFVAESGTEASPFSAAV